jgi:hypothetical protein
MEVTELDLDSVEHIFFFAHILKIMNNYKAFSWHIRWHDKALWVNHERVN